MFYWNSQYSRSFRKNDIAYRHYDDHARWLTVVDSVAVDYPHYHSNSPACRAAGEYANSFFEVRFLNLDFLSRFCQV